MPDIAMCANKQCTLKNHCYRFKAVPNPIRQDYGFFEQDESGHCAHFWEEREIVIQNVRRENNEQTKSA